MGGGHPSYFFLTTQNTYSLWIFLTTHNTYLIHFLLTTHKDTPHMDFADHPKAVLPFASRGGRASSTIRGYSQWGVGNPAGYVLPLAQTTTLGGYVQWGVSSPSIFFLPPNWISLTTHKWYSLVDMGGWAFATIGRYLNRGVRGLAGYVPPLAKEPPLGGTPPVFC
jgi:hypothetical protein